MATVAMMTDVNINPPIRAQPFLVQALVDLPYSGAGRMSWK